MESAEYSLDELLCQSLLLFRQYRFYDAPECGEKAFRILEEAHVWMGRTQECVDMAKWGVRDRVSCAENTTRNDTMRF